MSPEDALPYQSPFHHLRPELWKQSKVMHIVLMVIGTLLMVPLLYTLAVAAIFLSSFGGPLSSIPADELPGFISVLVSLCSGGFAWCALGLLFFKRTDARWQRICWAIAAVFGYISTPCTVGWWIYLLDEVPSVSSDPDILWFHACFLFITGVAVLCAVHGTRYSRRAGTALRTPPEVPSLPVA